MRPVTSTDPPARTDRKKLDGLGVVEERFFNAKKRTS